MPPPRCFVLNLMSCSNAEKNHSHNVTYALQSVIFFVFASTSLRHCCACSCLPSHFFLWSLRLKKISKTKPPLHVPAPSPLKFRGGTPRVDCLALGKPGCHMWVLSGTRRSSFFRAVGALVSGGVCKGAEGPCTHGVW